MFVPERLLTCKTWREKLVKALISLSGLQTLINKHFWKSVS